MTLDRIAQEPRVHHQQSEDPTVKIGTFVKVHWPRIAGFLNDQELLDFYHVSRLLAPMQHLTHTPT